MVIGDANVDLEIRLPSEASETHTNPDPRMFGGGSAANTASALAGLGEDCWFVGTVGDDNAGRFAIASLDKVGVNTASIVSIPEAATVTVITVLRPDGERLIYVWPPSGGAHGALQEDVAVAGVAGADWLHVSGICLRLSPAREAVLAAMEHARRAGKTVSLDLNLRLENWGWDNGFRAVIESAVARADIVMGAATDEIGPLAGMADPAEAARSIAGDARLVIARLGADGAIACTSVGVETAPSFPVQVEDTVGAGDAFNAGFIAARLRGLAIADALRWGNAVAALTVSLPGARSTPNLEQVRALLVD